MLNRKKSTKVLVITAIMILLIISIILFCTPTVKAEQNRTSGEFSEKGSLLTAMYADEHYMADARLSTYLHLKASGDGLFMVQGEIQPRINDGSHDYNVRWFTIDIKLNDRFNSLTSISQKDNSKEKIVTTTSGTTVAINNNGVTFEISTATSMTAGTSHMTANYSHYESIKGEGEINKSVHVVPLISSIDTTYQFTVAFFFKFKTPILNMLNYEVSMKEMRVDGQIFAPDYGTNNSESLQIVGNANVVGSHKCNGSIINIGSDGSPRDWLVKSSFEAK